MNEVQIRIGQHTYRDDSGHTRVARMGSTIEVADEELERGNKLGAFVGSVPEEVEAAAQFDVATAGVDEIAEYIREEKLNVKDTVALAGDDPDIAQRVLDAERALASDEGGDPRSGVIEPLEKIAE